MANEVVSHYYKHLLEDGYAMASIGNADTNMLNDATIDAAADAWRAGIRNQARMDKIKIRTRWVWYHATVIAVRLDWSPSEEIHDRIFRETELHVCEQAPEEQKLDRVQTPYCGWCGMLLAGRELR